MPLQKRRLEQLQRENKNDTPTKKADPKKSKHNTTGYDIAWENNRLWLYCSKYEDIDVMYCRLCQEHNTKEGYACQRLDKVKHQEQGEQHRQALELETRQQLGINNAINQEYITKMRRPLLLASNIFKVFIDFATHELHAPDLQHLSVGSNAKYTSHHTVDEFIDTMAEHVEDAVYTNIKSSPAYSIMADESTDVSNRKHLVFSAKYIDVSIYDATKDVIQTKLSLDNLVAFGSDGCNTMIGSKSAKHIFENIPLFRDVDDTLTHVLKYYHYSAVRTKSLRKIQKLLNDAEETKTIKNAVHTRWLSNLNAVTSLRDTYESVLVDLENATASGTDKRYRQTVQTSGRDKVRIGSGPSASSLLKKKLKNAATIRVVHFLCDALKPVSQLALTFERNDVELSTIHPQLQSTLMSHGRLKEKEGVNTTKSSALIKKINVTWKPNELESVHTAEKKFINGLVSNIMTTRLQNTEVIDKFSIFRNNIPDEVKNGL
ncbi:hypothetical protein ACJMK2_018865 [Sinanodonta woodiana]|uniref:DUF4371 domain-containing protein n=1 Tax=Sinanodonta woodiana TaxID=1069815 RepID=A0ABD3UHQ4_SINWO